MLLLNDVHLGVKRNGGTTPTSRENLRSYLFASFERALNTTDQHHACILGDLFDQFEVDGRDWVQCYLILQTWLSASDHVPARRLTLVAGNHDWSPKGTRISSFEILCRVLKEQFGDQVAVINIDECVLVHDEPATIAVAHCSNQDIFEQKLGEVMAVVKPGTRILLHANYDNNFAVESDHSLNVSADQAKVFVSRGATLYFAHEHQARTELGGSVVVFGNQWPTSIADCLNNDFKYLHVLSGSVDRIMTWARSDDLCDGTSAAGICGYGEVDWRNLGEGDVDPDGAQFIKIVGTASANEASNCLSAISKFRNRCSAFVMTNGVKIEGVLDNEALPEAFEATKAFDVMAFINSNLDERQRGAVVKLNEVVR
jgi:metallophosphoesterase superfamily enzyme